MIKLGNTEYTTESGNMNAQQIIAHQQEAKVCKRSRKLHCTYCTMDVQLDGMSVRLFFCKRGKGEWNGLLTTDMSLDFLEAYRLYASSIRVASKYYESIHIYRLSIGYVSVILYAGRGEGMGQPGEF